MNADSGCKTCDTQRDNASSRLSQPAAQFASFDAGASSPSFFTDGRPEAEAQRQLQAKADNSAPVKQLQALQKRIRQRPSGQQGPHGPAVTSRQGAEAPVQRTVVDSVVYVPNQGAAAIAALDGQIASSETKASRAVRNIGLPRNYVHTPHQAAYMRHPTPRGWGNCVEEQLNPKARRRGWSITNLGHGANPDYKMIVNGATVWADLTTATEAGAGGNHITGKLQTMASNGAPNTNTWEAADLVHGSLDPLAGGPRKAPKTKGRVTRFQVKAYLTYRGHLLDEGDYNPAMDKLMSKYGRFSYATFTQRWTSKRRSLFARAVNKAAG